MDRTYRMVIAAATFAAAGVLAPAAFAEERTCAGAIGAETLDNVRVPDGATCTLTGTRVQGTIKIERSATLSARDVRVVGNVQAENAADVVVLASTVGGSVQIKQGGGATVRRSAIDSDIQFDANARLLSATENRVGGNIQVVGNNGGATISSNTVDGNLQCKENTPAPTGSNNLVHGSAEDQCQGFAGGSGAPPAVGPGSGGALPQPGPVAGPKPRVGLRATRNGRRVVVAGRVTHATRRRGIIVAIQTRRAGRWQTLRRARTHSRGRYRARVLIRRNGRVALRAVVKRQQGISSRAHSRVVRLHARDR